MVRTIKIKKKKINLNYKIGLYFLFSFVFAVLVMAGSNDINLIGDDVDYSVLEDNIYSHNFSANITGTGTQITFSVTTDGGNKLYRNSIEINYSSISDWMYFTNFSQGLFLINASNDSMAGYYILPIKITWVNETTGLPPEADVANFEFNVSAYNDAPYFVNLSNQTMTWVQQEGFRYFNISVRDEENNAPYLFNISFINCSVAEWSDRNCSDPIDMQLFNSSEFFFNETSGLLNISFLMDRNDVGNYTINFSVIDYNNDISPNNNSFSKLFNFEVFNANAPPVFDYVCDNERNTSEGEQFSCRVNISDIDETQNLTLTVNQYSFFKLNNSYLSLTQSVNISTGYNASFLVNFTTSDAEVGNWSIILKANDTLSNATLNTFYFFVNNSNDNVSLQSVNMTNPAYTSSVYNFYINASDDDLLITQKNLFNEVLNFSSNESSWFIYNDSSVSINKTLARFSVYPGVAGEGYRYVNLSVVDSLSGSRDSLVIIVNITNNTAPSWNVSNSTFILTEDSNFYINLSRNVSDIDGDLINFSYTINDLSNTSFSLFNVSIRGIINFTPRDYEVGYHNVTIYAIDSRGAQTPFNFIFFVNNIADNPSLFSFDCDKGLGGFCVPSSITNFMNLSEDDDVNLLFYVRDDDLNINFTQKIFYNESITLNLTIVGPNTNLFSFANISYDPNYPLNLSRFSSDFILNKSDVGNYNVTINITDRSNRSHFIAFNLTVLENQHPPVIDELINYNLSIYESFEINVNSSDIEDGNESTGANFSYSLLNVSGENFLIINESTGVIINSSSLIGKGGIWNFSVTATDSYNMNDTDYFLIYIFDIPQILDTELYVHSYIVENQSYQFNFSASHAVESDLVYSLYINNVLRNSTINYGNGTYFSWEFTSNFTDETTCRGVSNITLNVSNQKLSNIYTWNLSVNHSNSPIEFISASPIGGGDSIVNGETPLDLSDHFRDIDASDSCYNQTIGFRLINLSSNDLSYVITNWSNGSSPSITFSGEGRVNYSVIGYEYNDSIYNISLNNVTSNNFTVNLSVTPEPDPDPNPSNGGRGGSARTETEYKPISLRIIVPDPVSVGKNDKIILPLTLENDGSILLSNITLSTNVAINGTLSSDVISNLSLYHINSLNNGDKVNLTLTATINTEIEGLYEINIFANVTSPVYSDFSKLYLTVKEGTSFEDKVIFTEELMVSNPECAEIQELVDEAKKEYQNGNIVEAEGKITLAINACKDAISQKPSPIIRNVIRSFGISNYLIIAVIGASLLGFLYYFYKRHMLSKAIRLEDIDD